MHENCDRPPTSTQRAAVRCSIYTGGELDKFFGRVAQYAEVVDTDLARASMQGLLTVLSAAGADRLRAAIAKLLPEYQALLAVD